ncbi:MAG: PaaI family thioesterase [Sedimentisphaerales bacterium]|nr:PaaI family thioesterase [Sedimentisphaerales bacterium]
MTKQPTSRTCFLCGRDNDNGLKMVWYNNKEQNQVEANVTIPEHFNGYPGITHGGIVAAILDETSGRAAMLNGDFDNLFITLRLNITYRKPTPTDIPLKVIGWIEKKGRRKMEVAAKILLPDKTICAECQAVVMEPTGEIADCWENEKKYWYVE